MSGYVHFGTYQLHEEESSFIPLHNKDSLKENKWSGGVYSVSTIDSLL